MSFATMLLQAAWPSSPPALMEIDKPTSNIQEIGAGPFFLSFPRHWKPCFLSEYSRAKGEPDAPQAKPLLHPLSCPGTHTSCSSSAPSADPH